MRLSPVTGCSRLRRARGQQAAVSLWHAQGAGLQAGGTHALGAAEAADGRLGVRDATGDSALSRLHLRLEGVGVVALQLEARPQGCGYSMGQGLEGPWLQQTARAAVRHTAAWHLCVRAERGSALADCCRADNVDCRDTPIWPASDVSTVAWLEMLLSCRRARCQCGCAWAPGQPGGGRAAAWKPFIMEKKSPTAPLVSWMPASMPQAPTPSTPAVNRTMPRMSGSADARLKPQGCVL